MDFETIVAYLKNKYMDRLSKDMSKEKFLAEVKGLTNEIEAEIISLCDEKPQDLTACINVVKSKVGPINERLDHEMREEASSRYHKNYEDLTTEEKITLDGMYGKVRIEDTKFSSSEKRMKEQQHEQAKGVFAKNVANYIAKDIAVSKFYPDVQMQRQTGAFLTKMATDPADALHLFEGVTTNDDNVKEELNKRFNEMIAKGHEIMDTLLEEMPDDKLIDFVSKYYLDMQSMAEWQNNNIEEVAEDLGIEISPENKEKLTDVSKRFAVTVSPFKDKIALMANPYYAKYDAKTIYSIKQVITDIDFDNYLNDEERDEIEILNSAPGINGKPDAFAQYRSKVDFNFAGNDFYRGSRAAALARLEDAVAYQLQGWSITENDIEYVINGHTVNVEDYMATTSLRKNELTPQKVALECALKGKKVGVFSKKDHKFLTLVTCRPNSLGFFDKIAKQPIINLKGNFLQANVSEEDSEEIKRGLRVLYNAMLKQNRWYISKKREFGKLMESISGALNLDLSVRSVFQEQMDRIKENAQAYLTDRFINKKGYSTLAENRFELAESALQTVMTLEEKIKGPVKTAKLGMLDDRPIQIKDDDLIDNNLKRVNSRDEDLIAENKGSNVISEDEFSEDKSIKGEDLNQSNILDDEDMEKKALELFKKD